MKHCDDYIEDPTAPAPLRAFLRHARAPAHGLGMGEPPKLFATYRGDAWQGIEPGDRVRVVMASRLGDVGVTKRLDATQGYAARFFIEQLGDFADAAAFERESDAERDAKRAKLVSDLNRLAGVCRGYFERNGRYPAAATNELLSLILDGDL